MNVLGTLVGQRILLFFPKKMVVAYQHCYQNYDHMSSAEINSNSGITAPYFPIPCSVFRPGHLGVDMFKKKEEKVQG